MTTTAIKEKPILFSREMILAILANRKTQTRRIVRSAYDDFHSSFSFTGMLEDELSHVAQFDTRNVFEQIACPYGAIGTRLWVRETWADGGYRDPDWACCVAYKADNSGMNYLCKEGDEPVCLDTPCKLRPEGVARWRPSIFMPRWASRITLEITDVRVERVQDISEADAIAEGIEIQRKRPSVTWKDYGSEHVPEFEGWLDPTNSYRTLWQSINGPESWNQNPYVWKISFKRV